MIRIQSMIRQLNRNLLFTSWYLQKHVFSPTALLSDKVLLIQCWKHVKLSLASPNRPFYGKQGIDMLIIAWLPRPLEGQRTEPRERKHLLPAKWNRLQSLTRVPTLRLASRWLTNSRDHVINACRGDSISTFVLEIGHRITVALWWQWRKDSARWLFLSLLWPILCQH